MGKIINQVSFIYCVMAKLDVFREKTKPKTPPLQNIGSNSRGRIPPTTKLISLKKTQQK